MTKLSAWTLAAVVVVALTLTSCRLFRRSKPVQPPVATTTQTPAPQPAPPPSQEPPKPVEPVETKPAEAVKRPSPAGPRVQPPAPATPPAASPPAPQLRPMLTLEQKSQLERTTNARIQRARQAAAILQGRRLTREQAEALSQIRTFLQQAEEARSTDLVRAGNLAERADVLAQDLLSSTR